MHFSGAAAPQINPSWLQLFGLDWGAFFAVEVPVPALQVFPFGQSRSWKHGRSGSLLQKPQ